MTVRSVYTWARGMTEAVTQPTLRRRPPDGRGGRKQTRPKDHDVCQPAKQSQALTHPILRSYSSKADAHAHSGQVARAGRKLAARQDEAHRRTATTSYILGGDTTAVTGMSALLPNLWRDIGPIC